MTHIKQQSQELRFALDIVSKAGELALDYYKQGCAGTMKADNTPVTIADQKCERMIREAIAQAFPNDDILGEEEGGGSAGFQPGATGTRKWIIDPIDGTYNFTRQVPVWSVLLALEVDGKIVLGVVNAPANEEIYWAEKNGGAHRNDEHIKVSEISKVSESQFEFGAPSRLREKGMWESLGRVIEATYRQRCYGDYVNFAHVFNAKAEAALEVGLKPWDIAPMQIIAHEAGGKFTDLDGGDSIYTGSCLVSNGKVHDELLKLLK
jgi:histidinol-phosphatase